MGVRGGKHVCVYVHVGTGIVSMALIYILIQSLLDMLEYSNFGASYVSVFSPPSEFPERAKWG